MTGVQTCALPIFYKPLFGSSVATCRLASVPKFHFQLSEKSQKEVPEKVEHSTIGRRRDGFSSALCSIKQIENLAAGATVLAQLFTLIEHTLSINVSVRYMRTLL